MTLNQRIQIEEEAIQLGRCFIIAEAGINHNGDMELAKRLVDMAADAGADAVKFQTFKAEEEVTKKLTKVEYQKSADDDQESYFEMIKKLEFGEAEHRELMAHCKERGVVFLSTPSEEVSARLLHTLEVPAFKIGSNDLVTLPMLEEIAGWGKPMILSSGMATTEEIQEALDIVSGTGNRDIVLLQCTSTYPCPPEKLNVAVVRTLAERFGVLSGFSDHSVGLEAAPLAVLLGAVVVEKHITVDRTLPGPDQSMALDPEDFRKFVAAIRAVEHIDGNAREEAIAAYPNAAVLLGNPEKQPTEEELSMRTATRKGIVAREPIPAGTVIEQAMLAYKRPYEGIPAKRYRDVLGKRARVDLEADEFITEDKLG